MFDKALVWGWGILILILIIENLVQPPMAPPYFLIWPVSIVSLVFFSLIIWIAIWFWIKWILSWKNNEEDLDF